MQTKIQEIRAKVAECISKAEKVLGVKMPAVAVRFDLTGRAAGMAGRRGDSFYLRFNVAYMALGGKTWEHLLNDTVPHEVAHTVCQANPSFGRNHNPGWKYVCRVLGGNGQRCYTAEDAPEAVARAKPFIYVTTTGHKVSVSPTIHNKIQRGKTYIYRGGRGELTSACTYSKTQMATV